MGMDGELLQLLYKNEIKSCFWREFPAYKDILYMRENSAPDNNWLNKIWFFLLLQ